MINSFFKRTAIVMMLAGISSVHATVSDLGNVNAATPTSFSGSVLPAGAFNDIFSFILPANNGSGYDIHNFPLSIPETGDFNTLLSSVSLYSNADGILFNSDDTFLQSFVVPSGSTTNFTWGPSVGGNMYLSVSGIANGSLGGLYNGAISVSPVPEPETFAMLLAGLGLIGAMVRRRTSSTH
ncbi:MAG: FxDxF family PEP-CTERM protein [Nitrosospira sp.]